MAVLLVKKRQPEARFKVSGDNDKQVLVIKSCKIVAMKSVVTVGPIIESCNVCGLFGEYKIVFILGILPLFELHIPCSLT